MSMELRQLVPWGNATLTLKRTETVTFLGQDYTYEVYELGPAPIATTRSRRLSGREVEVQARPNPDPDSDAPTLSNAAGSYNGQSGFFDAQIDTDEAGGRLRFMVNQDDATTIQGMKDGQKQGVADAYVETLVEGAGTYRRELQTGPLASGTYYAHYLHTDEYGNDSNFVTRSFTVQ